jgi:hypothetical protein
VQNRYLEEFLLFCPAGKQLRQLALQFRKLLRGKSSARLSEWMEKVTAEGDQAPDVRKGEVRSSQSPVLPWVELAPH